MSPYQRPAFVQSFDKSRPHELLTANASKSGFLEYRMLDSGEVVSVTNVWYTQTAAMRASCLEFQANHALATAQRYESHPPIGCSKTIAAEEARRYRASAEILFRKAAWMLAAVARPELEAVDNEPDLDLFVPMAKSEK